MLLLLVTAVAASGPDPKALEALWASGCTERDIEAFADNDPAELRAAIETASQTWRAAAKPGRATHVVGSWRGQPITYEIGLPETSDPVAAFVTPAHPTWPAESPGDLRAPFGGSEARIIVHGYDVMYRAWGEARYLQGQNRASWYAAALHAWRRALAHAVAHYPIDPDHLICVGTSASGNACWQFGVDEPDRLAALMPISSGWLWGDQRDRVGNLLHTAVWIQHGAEDPKIPGEWPRAAAAALAEIGAPHELRWLEGEGHGNHPLSVLAEGAAWTLSHARVQDPSHLHFGRPRKGVEQAWWLSLPGRRAGVAEASWTPAGVVLRLQGARRFELVWRAGFGPGRGHAGELLQVVVNGQPNFVRLVEDAVTPLREWCRTGDTRDLPRGTAVFE